MPLEYSCSFLLLLRQEPYELAEKTLQSLIAFKQSVYAAAPAQAQVICIAGDGQTSAVPRLREYAHSHDLDLFARPDWDLSGEQGSFLMPEVAGLCNIGLARTFGECVCLIAPGHVLRTDGMNVLASTIQSVGSDHKLLAVSHDVKTTPLPTSAILNSQAVRNYGPLLTAADGYAISCKKRLFGGFQYDRQEPHGQSIE